MGKSLLVSIRNIASETEFFKPMFQEEVIGK